MRRGIAALTAMLLSLLLAGAAAAVLSSKEQIASPRTTSPYSVNAPGVIAPMTALARLAIPHDPPPALLAAMRRAATVTGGDPMVAARTLRLLRTGLGPDGGELYAYSPDGRAVCFIHWRRTGACPAIERLPLPGVLETFSPGGFTLPSQTVEHRPVIAGIASDNVARFFVVVNGLPIEGKIVNNGIYVEIPRPRPDEPWDIEVRAEYHDGSTAAVRYPDPRG
jgi:hypothetical protein